MPFFAIRYADMLLRRWRSSDACLSCRDMRGAIRQVTVAATLALVAYAATPAIGQTADNATPSSQDRLDAFVRKVSATPATAALLVVDLSDLRVVASLNPRTPMIPASNQKIFVMAAGLDLLGPDFSFETRLATDGQSLFVIGDGDPGFGDPRLSEREGVSITSALERWAASLKSRGTSSFPGSLIVDESIFDDQRVHPSWDRRDLQKWYAAPVGGLNINDNCIDVTASPGGKVGTRPHVSIMPPASIVEIDNRARTASKGVPVVGRVGESFTYRVSRNCGKRSTLESVAVPDGGLLFAHAFKHQLDASGIAVGEIERRRVRRPDGTLPSNLRMLDSDTTPIADVLGRIGKNSQNLFAECLAKRLGYEHQRRNNQPNAVGSWTSAAAAISGFLDRAGIATAGFEFADGSGLSRDNRATVTQIVGVLAHMHRHSSGPLFADSLAIPGNDGSLRRRMHGLANHVRAKTGTLRGVRTLAGYVTTESGKTFAFGVFFNNVKGSSKPYKQLQNQLCQLVADLDTGSTP